MKMPKNIKDIEKYLTYMKMHENLKFWKYKNRWKKFKTGYVPKKG